jgi:hypothetical protein
VELLCSAIDLPAPEYLEGFAVHDEHAGGPSVPSGPAPPRVLI